MGKIKIILAVVIVALYIGICEGLYFDAKEIFLSGNMKTAVLDFSVDSNSIENQQVSFEGGRQIGVDFNLVNTGSSDIFIRLNVMPIICDENNQDLFYKINDFNISGLEDWYRGDDGYFYYINSIREGESIDKELLAEVDFEKKLEGKDIRMYIKIESIQARNNIYPEVWDIGGILNE